MLKNKSRFVWIPGFLFVALGLHLADAANLEVDLTTDPKTNYCVSKPPGIVISGYALSNNSERHVYEAGFDPTNWNGSLTNKKPNFGLSGKDGGLDEDVIWHAGTMLSHLVSSSGNTSARNILTSKNETSISTVPFNWMQLSNAQKNALNVSAKTKIDDQRGEQRLNYLRGDQTAEIGSTSGSFRRRSGLLGDIVNSSPVYVGAPSTSLLDKTYSAFREKYKNRQPVVIVGANDGMLHAFDAESGRELFAYIPNALFPTLSYLTEPDYRHRAYVDGPLAVTEARIGATWATVLVAGMGRGAQGVFALDVTDAANFGNGAGALWEFTDADDADMGNVVGAPAIVKLKVKQTKGVAEYGYFALIAGGLNSYVNDGSGKFNPKASSALFLLSLEKSTSEKWKLGVNYFKFTLPAADTQLPNGITDVAVVVGNDGAIRHAYSGDLQGNVWRLDLSGIAPWSNALTGTSVKPIFTALDDAGRRQPITQRLNIVNGPGGYLVLFGTGKLLDATDLEPANVATQSFYAILDRLDNQKISGRSRLAKRTLIRSTSDNVLEINGHYFQYGLAGRGDAGWYFDLIDSARTGERSIQTAETVGSILSFNTIIPQHDPCKSSSRRTYTIQTLNGLSATADLTGYLAPSSLLNPPSVLLPVTPTEVSSRDATGKRKVTNKIRRIDPSQNNTEGNSQNENGKVIEQVNVAGRLNWREVVNWNELRKAVK
jgi:type IV pilus assembly protein PilY1